MKGIGILTDKAAVGEVKEDAKLVAEAIRRIILTRPFERPRTEFGSLIHRALFEQNNETTSRLAAFYIANAIQKHEPRVIIKSIVPKVDGNKLILSILFELKESPGQTFLTQVTVQ